MQQLNLFGEPIDANPSPELHEKVCTVCGTTFFAKRSNAKYCSNDCRTAARSRRQLEPHEARVEAETEVPNLILFPGAEPLSASEIDASLLARIIDNQQVQIEIQQRMIDLLHTTLERLTNSPLGSSGPRRTSPAPFDSDDLPGIEVKDATTSGESSQNFLNSMFNL